MSIRFGVEEREESRYSAALYNGTDTGQCSIDAISQRRLSYGEAFAHAFKWAQHRENGHEGEPK